MINNKQKTIQSKIAPNPNEAAQWVDLSADPYGTVIKTYNGKQWVNESDETAKVELLRKETNNKLAATDKKISQANEDLATVNKTLLGNIDNVSTELTAAKEKITALEKTAEETATNTEQITSLQQTIAAIQARIEVLENQIKTE